MKESSSKHLQAIVHGRVQGVGFRYFAQRHAISLGLVGFVTNQWDGTVLVEAEGEEKALLQFMEHLARGPSGAWVEKVEANWLPPTGEYRHFRVEY